MDTSFTEKLRHAEESINQSGKALGQFAELFQSTEHDSLLGTDYHGLQLLLQYRLCAQDILGALFHFQKSLWQVLGISPSASAAVNYERLAYALGSEDLHVLLSMLNNLIAALLKLIARLEKEDQEKKQKSHRYKKSFKYHSIPNMVEAYVFLESALEHQKEFKLEVLDLTQRLQVIAGAPEMGEVLNYETVLEGPISRFYQAVLNGLILAGSLFQQYEMKTSLTPELTDILHQLHHALTLLAPQLEPQRFFEHKKTHRLSGQDLEERASYKRLGNFFAR